MLVGSEIIIPSEVNSEAITEESTEVDTDLETRMHLVTLDQDDLRLDRALALAVPEFSRSYMQQLLAQGCVRSNGVLQVKASKHVRAGDQLQIELQPTEQSQAYVPEDLPIEVVYEDAHLLIVNKPAGLVVHPAPGNWRGTLLNGLLFRYMQAKTLPRAGIVHRLDKDTSGLMVVAKSRLCMDALVRLIAAREVSREYLALAHGAWRTGVGEHNADRIVSQSIGRDPRNRLKMAAFDATTHHAKAARTDITVLHQSQAYTWVQCKLHTGRTHQIRVHMAYLGHPLVADGTYGGKQALGLKRQALHAKRLAFKHPMTHEDLEFFAPLPPDIEAALKSMNET